MLCEDLFGEMKQLFRNKKYKCKIGAEKYIITQ